MPVKDPNEHVPAGERTDHPAVQRMKRQKLMKKVKNWAILLGILGAALGAYVWKMKSAGKDITLENVGENLLNDAKGGLKEAFDLGKELADAYQKKDVTPTDSELDKIVKKKDAKPPDAGTTTTPTPNPTPADPKNPTPPTPAPPAEQKLSPEEQKAKDLIKEANKRYDESRVHYEKFAASKDAAVRKREVNAAFDAVEKAKVGYQKARDECHVDSDWLNDRIQECLQRYKLLKNAKGAN